MIHVMWKYKIDPDNSAIPFLTALGDLFGSCLLAVAFALMIAIGKPYIDTNDELRQGPAWGEWKPTGLNLICIIRFNCVNQTMFCTHKAIRWKLANVLYLNLSILVAVSKVRMIVHLAKFCFRMDALFQKIKTRLLRTFAAFKNMCKKIKSPFTKRYLPVTRFFVHAWSMIFI